MSFEIVDYIDNEHVYEPVDVTDKIGRLKNRDKIESLQSAISDLIKHSEGVEEQRELMNEQGLKEYLVSGAYVRELLIPKDRIVVSKIWKQERMWIIATGEVTFLTEMGKQRVKAPFTKVVPLGSKVALYSHEDTLWFAVTGVSAENLDNVEEEVVTENYSDCVYSWDKSLEVNEQCHG